jgi:Aspartyl protease
MSVIKCLASMSLAAIILPALYAEAHCPGNVASLPFRFVNRHQIVLAISINHTGPYDFLLDSGTQLTMIDPSLAAALHLDTQGTAVVAGAGSRQSASFAQLDLVEAGSHAVAHQKVLVYGLKNLHSADLHIQGILGEDFLEHFDMLIDNAHRLLCLDDSPAMRAEVKGPHIPLVNTAELDDRVAVPGLLIIAASLSDGIRPARLLLDSGAQAPILYNTPQYMELQLSHDVPLRGSGVDGEQRIFSALPPQDVKIGSLELSRVPFFSLAGIQKDARVKGFDGVLPTGLFRRVFIDHADHFAVLEPR